MPLDPKTIDALDSALKSHVDRVSRNRLDKLELYPEGVLITYGQLRELAGVAVPPIGIGPYLTAIASRAVADAEPPPDCLVVNKASLKPGSAHFATEGSDTRRWQSSIDRVLGRK